MRLWVVLIIVLASMAAAFRAFADEPKADGASQAKKSGCPGLAAENKSGCTAAKGEGCGSGGECCQAKAGAKLPAISYKVGDKEFCCDKEAAEVAKASNATITYVVGGKTFAKQDEAMTAYADLLEKHLDGMLTVKFVVGDECVACPTSAQQLAKEKRAKVQYRLAAYDFESQEKADKAAGRAREAAEKVSIKMVVGDEAFQCPVSAKDASQKSGKPVEYAVGDCKSQCQTTARINLAKAKIDAASKALADAAHG